MKNVIVANFPKDAKKSSELSLLLEAQVFNTRYFGWKGEDFIIVSNSEKHCDFGTWIRASLNENCLTGSKLFAVKYLYANGITKDSIWAHDLDAWQNAPFVEPEFKDCGFSCYAIPKINGGSQFWKKSAIDVLEYSIGIIARKKLNREEPSLWETYLKYKNRITILNERYNIGCSGFVERYSRAVKPILVCHLHPSNRIAWQTHTLDRDGMGYYSVSPELAKNIRKFYSPATELDEEGSKARIFKINKRLKKSS